MTRIPGWLRRLRQAIPLLRSHAGRHIGAVIEAAKDMGWGDQLHQITRELRGRRPVYTPPQRLRVVLPCYEPDPRWALEVHHGPERMLDGIQTYIDEHFEATLAHLARPIEPADDEPHKDTVAGVAHNLDMLDDIRAERTRNLPGRGALTSADMTKLAPAGEPGTNQRQGNWKSRPLPHLQRTWADDTGSFTALADVKPEALGPAGLQYVRDYLTCSIEDLAAAIRADKMGLAVGQR